MDTSPAFWITVQPRDNGYAIDLASLTPEAQLVGQTIAELIDATLHSFLTDAQKA